MVDHKLDVWHLKIFNCASFEVLWQTATKILPTVKATVSKSYPEYFSCMLGSGDVHVMHTCVYSSILSGWWCAWQTSILPLRDPRHRRMLPCCTHFSCCTDIQTGRTGNRRWGWQCARVQYMMCVFYTQFLLYLNVCFLFSAADFDPEENLHSTEGQSHT